VLVVHACNPSYSGGRDQEDCGSKPDQANSSSVPILKKPTTKKGWQSGSRCRPELNPSAAKKTQPTNQPKKQLKLYCPWEADRKKCFRWERENLS
jgi:hypothetical protein